SIKDPDRHDGFLVDPDLEEQDITGSRSRTISDNWETPVVELNPELQNASLQKDRRTLPAVFRWHEPCKSVYIICSADNWQKKHYLQLDKVDAKNSSRHESVYLTIIELPEGRHEYRYVVDGVDRHHPKEKTVENSSGGLNHVLRVREEDFEALDALLMDAAAEKSDSDSEYGQIEPKMLTPMEAMKARNQPPALPNHLLHKDLLIVMASGLPCHYGSNYTILISSHTIRIQGNSLISLFISVRQSKMEVGQKMC
ncbi:unnamed protein product, partial [Oikopleura dioica]